MITPQYRVVVRRGPDGPYIVISDGCRSMVMDANQARAAAYDLNLAAVRAEQLKRDETEKGL